MEKLSGYHSALEGFHERLNSSIIELDDLAREIEGIYHETDFDPEQLEQRQLLVAKVRKRIAELEQQKIDLEITLGELYEIERQALENLPVEESGSAASERSQ